MKDGCGMAQTTRDSSISIISTGSFLFAFTLHAAVFYGMWHHRFPVMSSQPVILTAEIITSPQSKIETPEAPQVDLKAEPVPHPPEKPKTVKKTPPQPKRQRLASSAPALPEESFVTPSLSQESIDEPKPVQQQAVQSVTGTRAEQMQTGPVTLTSELSVSCPELRAPDYPAHSRRLGEEGRLVVRVELDESGRVSHTHIVNSSGYSRLDDAALTAVKTWHCRPALRDGQPVQAVALQPFNFVLQGN